jgi:multiple sugar transport system permease protein
MSGEVGEATAQGETRVQRMMGMGRIGPKWFPMFMLLPAFVFVLIVTGFPLLYSLYVSFTPYELLRPNSLNFEMPTALRNYERLLGDEVFWRSLGNTLLFLVVTVNLEYVLALGLSQLLARVTHGQGLMRTMLMIPMMFAPILVGFQFRWFFNANLGLVNNFFVSLGLMTEQSRVAWLVDEPWGMISIMLATIWMNLPVMTIILLAGTLSLPQETYEAAEVDGASAWQRFRFITIPLLAPFTYIALTVRSLDVARAFDIVRIMTDGGPAHRTELMWTYVTRLAIEDTKFGLGSAMSWVTVIVSLAFTVYLFRQLVKSRIVQ